MKKKMLKYWAENSALILKSTAFVVLFFVVPFKTWFGRIEEPKAPQK